jgi:hypothetical protein
MARGLAVIATLVPADGRATNNPLQSSLESSLKSAYTLLIGVNLKRQPTP